MGKSYDPNEDYKKKMDEAAAAGDYAAAARYEQQRNAKIQGEGLTQYQTTNQYGQYLPAVKPAAPQQTWQEEMEQTLKDILNRKPFSYDVNSDALYQQYAQQYAQQGRLAMEDTMGKAAALTGGYGNSYAQSVGQQTYQGYMDKLNDRVPELEQLAYQRYQAEGDALYDRYAMMQAAEDRDWSRYQNQLSEYYNQVDRKEAAQGEERDRAYSLALQMLQSGMMPSETLLSLSGISTEDAQKIFNGSTVSYGGGYGDGGGSYGGSSGGGSVQAVDPEKDALSTKDWSALFQLYQKGAKSGDLTGYYSELANYAREFDTSEFEDYMAKHTQGYQSGEDHGMYGGGLDQATFAQILQSLHSAPEDRVRTLLDLYAGQASAEQWAQIEDLLKKRRMYE